MGKHKDLSKFDKGQIVMARRLGHSISKTAILVGCSRSAVVSTVWCVCGCMCIYKGNVFIIRFECNFYTSFSILQTNLETLVTIKHPNC